MLSNLFPIKIHVWGGLGSQLFALALAFHLKERFTHRKLIIIYHTFGVTKRTWDLPLNLENLVIIVKDDFNLINKIEKPNLFLKKLNLDKLFKFVYGLLGFYADCNTTSKTMRIKPWVKDIRGHYSHRNISTNTLYSILNLLEKNYGTKLKPKVEFQSAAIQYRLGDLMNLNTKSFVSEKTIIKLIEQNSSLWPQKTFDLYSDSLEDALGLLSMLNLTPNECSPHSTVLRCLNYKYFIGTNSKLTIWIILFRLSQDINSYNFIPGILKSELSQCCSDLDKFRNLKFYN